MRRTPIFTLTPNPALDVFGRVLKLVPNEKCYVHDETRIAGGNSLNAGRIAKLLGSSVLASGFLGGCFGEEYLELVKSEKIPSQFIPIRGDTRINITVSDGKAQTRLSFPGPKVTAKEVRSILSLLNRLHPELTLVGGSLPQGLKVDFIKRILRENHKFHRHTFVDVPGHLLKLILSERPFFIKPNLSEFQEMLGKKVESIADVLKAAQALSHQVPIQCISSVEGGALLVTSRHAWFGRIPKNLKVRSTVGAGDAMVGAMAHELVRWNFRLDERHAETILRLGLSAAAATLESPNASQVKKSHIRQFEPKVLIRKIR